MAVELKTQTGEQTRARYPDAEGYLERDGVRVFWELYGEGDQTILLLPTWSIVHSRFWKMQIPYLARHCRVLTFDPRGNGRSDRPRDGAAYSEWEFAADALAVLDATQTARAVLVSLSLGAHRALILAAEHPERVAGAVFIGASVPLAAQSAERAVIERFDDVSTPMPRRSSSPKRGLRSTKRRRGSSPRASAAPCW